MTLKQRAIVIGIVCGLLLSGFAFGRITSSPASTNAEENKSALASAQEQTQNSRTPSTGRAFYLQDFKNGYDDGFNSRATGEVPTTVTTDPAAYDEGFKQGYADSYKTQLSASQRPVVYRSGQQVVYKPARVVTVRERRHSSKLKTALTIAAPAAIGAGIGALAGGGKGAAVGALIGGGGGAAYHLYKNRHR